MQVHLLHENSTKRSLEVELPVEPWSDSDACIIDASVPLEAGIRMVHPHRSDMLSACTDARAYKRERMHPLTGAMGS